MRLYASSKTDSNQLSVDMDAGITAQEQAGQDLRNNNKEEADEIFQQQQGVVYQSELQRLLCTLQQEHALEEVRHAAAEQYIKELASAGSESQTKESPKPVKASSSKVKDSTTKRINFNKADNNSSEEEAAVVSGTDGQMPKRGPQSWHMPLSMGTAEVTLAHHLRDSPAAVVQEGDWRCPLCNTNNFADQRDCYKANCPAKRDARTAIANSRLLRNTKRAADTVDAVTEKNLKISIVPVLHKGKTQHVWDAKQKEALDRALMGIKEPSSQAEVLMAPMHRAYRRQLDATVEQKKTTVTVLGFPNDWRNGNKNKQLVARAAVKPSASVKRKQGQQASMCALL